MKSISLPAELEMQIDELISNGMFRDFEAAVEELIRLGIAAMKGTGHRNIPPGQVPQPEKPFIPDPSRDILKM